jgi:hypothetical protein
MRHTPKESKLKKVLPWLAAEKPDVFNAYQQTHGPHVERSMLRSRYVASFIGHQLGKALFIGLYLIEDSRPFSDEDWSVPANIEMKAFGMKGFPRESSRSSILWFDLALRISTPPGRASSWSAGHRPSGHGGAGRIGT